MQPASVYTKFVAILLIATLILTLPVFSSVSDTAVIASTGNIISGSSVVATSGSVEDIQEAVDLIAAKGGGTVYIPEGSFAFSIDPNKKAPDSYPGGVFVPGGVNIIGAGVDKTILYQPDEPPNRGTMFFVTGQNTEPVRISNITFVGYVETAENDNHAIILQSVTDFRVDHCSFVDFSGFAIMSGNEFYGGINRGVIDHCDFDNPYKDEFETKGISYQWAYGIIPSASGSNPRVTDVNSLLGHYDDINNVVYIEDCTFKRCRHAVASSCNAWYVVRHCTLSMPRPRNFYILDVHGGLHPGRGLEAYDNIITAEGYYGAVAFGIRAGSGVIYDNSVTDCGVGIWLMRETPGYVDDLWIWNNNMPITTPFQADTSYVEGTDYFFNTKTGYTPYQYPHPLTLVN